MATVTTIFHVEGMSCSHCEDTIKNSVGVINGICNVAVDLTEKTVAVEYDEEKISPQIIKEIIEDQGYEVK